MLSVLLNRYRAELFVRDSEKDKGRFTDRLQSGADSDSYNHQRTEDTGSMK